MQNVTESASTPDIQTLLTQIEQMKAEKARLEREVQEHKQREAKLQEEKSLKLKIASCARFYPTRNTLVLRRTLDHELIAPARDVFDYLELYDMKEKVRMAGTKTRVPETDLVAYQQLKAEGVQDVTPKMVADRVKVNNPAAGDNTPSEENDNVEVME